MPALHRFSIAEQAAAHLREGLRRGHWQGTMPGVRLLAAELDVSKNIMEAALRQLESERLLTAGRPGCRRTIRPGAAGRSSRRVGILAYDDPRGDEAQQSHVLLPIRHDLEAEGHEIFFGAKSQVQLRHDVQRIAAQVGKNPADAWIVLAGSRPVLEWFAGQAVPCLAVYGRTEGLELARTGPDKLPSMLAAVRRLLALGHSRIVLLNRVDRRKPVPGLIECSFLAELRAHGLPAGDFNLPDWEETPAGLARLLEGLFEFTPPTALIISEVPIYLAAAQWLARQHLDVPGRVSLVCADYNGALAWFHPTVAHMRWDIAPIVRRIVRWVAAVDKGRADRLVLNYPAEFVDGGSIGPVRKK